MLLSEFLGGEIYASGYLILDTYQVQHRNMIPAWQITQFTNRRQDNLFFHPWEGRPRVSVNLPVFKHNRPTVRGGIAEFGFIVTALGLSGQYVAAMPAPLDQTRQTELIKLVRQDCGSCHGLTLKGGLGPALVPDALKDKPADYLKAIILHGRAGTAMPPWLRFLSDADTEWIVINLKKGCPDGH